MSARPKILFLGMGGPLSVAPLLWLIENGVAPQTIAVPAHLLGSAASASELPVERPAVTCAQVARKYEIPLAGVMHEWTARLAEHDCDLLLSACWPWRIPENVLRAYPGGAYNLHPSLLPQFRGPAPLFWQLRHGVSDTGITLHRLSAAWDAGPIVAQRTLEIRDNDTEQSLGPALGALSGALLAQWLRQIDRGAVAMSPQNEAESSYHPMPGDADFAVPVGWRARRAYRFIRGTAARGHPFQIDLGTRRVRVSNALAYYPDQELPTALQRTDQCLRVQFADGVVDLVPA